MSRKSSRILILLCALSALLLFAFFLKDILIPFVRMEINNDVDGAKELLCSKGPIGFLIVPLVEAFQMVVIFIPAEFIQISSGLSYPFPIALLLCDLGVCLGASIIFLLVRTLKFHSEAYDKQKETIDTLARSGKKHRSTVLFMLLLFIMPLVPFGAICYYGSSTKIKYRNYILTVAGGVIPSIVTSNLMGEAAKAFIRDALPLWLLILIIILLGGALLAVLIVFLNRFFFRESDDTPDSPLYPLMYKIAALVWGKKLDVKIENGLPKDLKAPYVLLANHQSFYDFYLVSFLGGEIPAAYVANEYYLGMNPFFRWATKKAGFIPKKLFTFDMVTPAGIFRTIKRGYPVIIFPEGRLSVDGTTNPIVDRSAAFYRKLSVPLVLLKISGAYFGKPKWRKKAFRTSVTLNVERVITPDDIKSMTDDELNMLIDGTLSFDASDEISSVYRRGGRAKGLERILYRCADCGTLYSTKGVNNDFICTACGTKRSLNERYLFEEPSECREHIHTISGYYRKIKALEEKEIDALELTAHVAAKHFDKDIRVKSRKKGICTLTPESFSYTSSEVSFSIPTEKLSALPFSCGEEFETYYENELYYFYPAENRNQVARWALAVDILKERRDNEAR